MFIFQVVSNIQECRNLRRVWSKVAIQPTSSKNL